MKDFHVPVVYVATTKKFEEDIDLGVISCAFMRDVETSMSVIWISDGSFVLSIDDLQQHVHFVHISSDKDIEYEGMDCMLILSDYKGGIFEQKETEKLIEKFKKLKVKPHIMSWKIATEEDLICTSDYSMKISKVVKKFIKHAMEKYS